MPDGIWALNIESLKWEFLSLSGTSRVLKPNTKFNICPMNDEILLMGGPVSLNNSNNNQMYGDGMYNYQQNQSNDVVYAEVASLKFSSKISTISPYQMFKSFK